MEVLKSKKSTITQRKHFFDDFERDTSEDCFYRSDPFSLSHADASVAKTSYCADNDASLQSTFLQDKEQIFDPLFSPFEVSHPD